MTAPGYGCEYCGGEHPVNWLITHLNPAMTVSVCDEDFPVAMLPIIAGELGVDPGEFYQMVSEWVNARAEAEAAEQAAADEAIEQAELDELAAAEAAQDPTSAPGPAGAEPSTPAPGSAAAGGPTRPRRPASSAKAPARRPAARK